MTRTDYHARRGHTTGKTTERLDIEAAIGKLLIKDGRIVTRPADFCKAELLRQGFTLSQIGRGMNKLGVVSLPALCLVNTERAQMKWWWWAPEGYPL